MTSNLYQYFKSVDKFLEALDELKEITINRNTGKVYAVFRSINNNTDYDVIIDIFNFKYCCSCKAFTYNKLCKHVRLALFLAFFYDKLSMQYFRKASFQMLVIDKDYTYYYRVHKGRIIVGQMKRKFDVI